MGDEVVPEEDLVKVEVADEEEEELPESEEQALALNLDGLQYWLREVLLENIKLEKQLKESKESRLLAAEVCRNGIAAVLPQQQQKTKGGPTNVAGSQKSKNPASPNNNMSKAERKRKRAAMQAAEAAAKRQNQNKAHRNEEARNPNHMFMNPINAQAFQPGQGNLGPQIPGIQPNAQDLQRPHQFHHAHAQNGAPQQINLIPHNSERTGPTQVPQMQPQSRKQHGIQSPGAASNMMVTAPIKSENYAPSLDFIQRQRGLL